VSPLLLASFLVEATTAQETHAPPPPAIPADDGDDPPQRNGPRDQPHTPAELQAAMSFKSQHLEVRQVTSWRGSGSTVVTSGYYGYGGGPRGGPSYGMGVSTASPQTIVPEHAWTVFQGPMRLTVPDYLTLVGDDRADDVRRRIRSARTTGTLFTAIGVAGVGAVVAGIIGSANADTHQEREDWNTVALAGTGGLIVGFTIGGAAQSSASRLTTDYSKLGWEPTQAQVDAYNEALRTQLGLSPEQAWSILENGGPRR
jgi:hypothetical protein